MIKCKKILAIDLLYFMCWGIILLPPIVSHFSSLLANCAVCFGFFLFLVLLIIHNNSITNWGKVWPLFLFVIWCMCITLIKSPNKLFSLILNSVIPIIEVFFLAQWSINSKKNRSFRALNTVCKFYIVCNFFSMLIWPHGIFRSSVGSSVDRVQWIFGSKNNVALYMIVFCVIVAWYNYYYENSNKNFLIYAAMSLFSVVMCGENGIGFFAGSSTGIVAIAGTLLLIYYRYLTNEKKVFSISNRMLLIMLGIIYFIILAGGILPVIQAIIVSVLHKTLTYSGRTSIWKTTIVHILESMWIGHGEIDFYSSVYIENKLTYTTYTYNAALKIILNYGVIGLALLVLVIFTIRNHNMPQCKLLFSGFIGLSVIGLMNELDIKWIMFFPMIICCLANLDNENRQVICRKKKRLIRFSF